MTLIRVARRVVGACALVLVAMEGTGAWAAEAGMRVALANGLVLYQDLKAAASGHVVIRVVDTKIGADARAYPATASEQDARESGTLWRGERPIVNATLRSVAFGVSYGPGSRGGGASDVVVTCDRTMKISTIRCAESPLASWRQAFPGASRRQILEHAAAEPRRFQR